LQNCLPHTLLLLPLISCGGGSEVEHPANVLFISIDTLRADHLSAWGYERATSPHIDALAAAGVLCEDAYSTTSWTLPAHHSMLTGLYPSAHGVCDERLWQAVQHPDGPEEVPQRGASLGELLAQRGYRTGGIYTWMYLEERFGFGRGFEDWERIGRPIYEDPHYERLLAAGDAGAIEELRREHPERFDQHHPTSALAVDAALEWLQRDDERPYFLFLHLFDVHDDYVPPAPFDSRFDPEYAGDVDGEKITSADSPFKRDMDPRDLEHVIALYDGEIAWVDSQIGRLLEGLERLGLSEDTLVVLTSDHGEEFFEHGHKTHRTHLYRESVHVPLLLRFPGRLPAGMRVRGPVSIVDILPTVCSLLDVPAPAGLSGSDLAPILRAERENEPRTYLSELQVFPEGSFWPARELGIHRGEQHWILSTSAGGTRSATRFDLSTNPRESGDGQALDPDAEELARPLRELRELVSAQRRSAPARAGGSAALTSAEIEALADVGYAGLEEEGPTALGGNSGRLCLDGCIWPGP